MTPLVGVRHGTRRCTFWGRGPSQQAKQLIVNHREGVTREYNAVFVDNFSLQDKKVTFTFITLYAK